MSQSPIVVFISHVHEDETLASCLKEFLEGIFLNATVFVSGRDLGGGQVWVEELRRNLEKATSILALVTRFSENNNWVHFEAGAGFSGQRTIPVLADGVSISTLNPPFKLLQARAYDEDGLEAVAKDIARHAHLREPTKFPDLDKTLREAANFIALRTSATSSEPEVSDLSKPSLSDDQIYQAAMQQAEAVMQRARALLIRDILRRNAAFEVPTASEMSRLELRELNQLAKAVGVSDEWRLPSIKLDRPFRSLPCSKTSAWEKVNYEREMTGIREDLDQYEQFLNEQETPTA